MEFTRQVNNAVYSRKALAAARDAYANYCTIRATPGAGLVSITVSVKDDYAQDSRRVILEFWNYFLDTACQQHLESE